MRRDLSRLSSSLKLFIRHPYSQSSKASNPCLPRWSTDREADRRVDCKSVQKLFNTTSMTEHFTFTTFQHCYQREAAKQRVPSASGNPAWYDNAQMHELRSAEGHIVWISLCSKTGSSVQTGRARSTLLWLYMHFSVHSRLIFNLTELYCKLYISTNGSSN